VQGVPDEDLVAEHADGAVAADATGQDVAGILAGLDPPGQGPGGAVLPETSKRSASSETEQYISL